MTREIKFRGKSIDTNEWVYGSYHSCVGTGKMGEWNWDVEPRALVEKDREFNNHWILVPEFPYDNGWGIRETFIDYEVNPETVGQRMKVLPNGVEVYEGDVVKFDLTEALGEPYKSGCKDVVRFNTQFNFMTRIEVVGNIHDGK